MALAVPPGGSPRSAPAHEPDTVLLPVAQIAPPVVRRTPSRPVGTVELTVVIVNFCQWRNTARLVTQLRRSDAVRSGIADITVIDNHSPSHSLTRRLTRLRGVTVRRFGRNRGFARAVNHGCEQSRGQWMLLLNPDVTVADGFLDDVLASMERLAENEPRAGVVGFRLRNPDGSDQASSGPFPTFPNTLAGLLLPRSRRKCRHVAGPGRQAVPWVTGGCLLVRRNCFEQLGGLDERFFLYYEDADFCRRAEKHGWSVWYDPALEVTHHWPLHARRVPAPLRLITRHALLTYARKHWSRWQARLLTGVVRTEAGLRRGWAWLRGDADAARCYAELGRLIGDVVRGRDGAARDRITFAAGFLEPVAAAQDGRT